MLLRKAAASRGFFISVLKYKTKKKEIFFCNEKNRKKNQNVDKKKRK